jgi:DNA-binding transcriptional regulator GbsR (MarR family)
MGDRRDHFEAIQDITQLFRVIADERKRRELDPTVAMLREEAAKDDGNTPAHVRQKLKATLSFLELLTKWYEDMKGLPHPMFLAVLKLGARVQRFLKNDG